MDFLSLVYWRTHDVETTMFMRWTYFSDFKPIEHQWRNYDEIVTTLSMQLLRLKMPSF
jgi:hypothetical protein